VGGLVGDEQMQASNQDMTVRRADERGRGNYGWLDTRYTFSFADYLDPKHMGFRDLRVINEDWIAAARGFPEHSHQDMEILTYILAGSIEHADSQGNHGVVRAGDLQRMTAGTGIVHSEKNPSADEELHLFQIWLLPERNGLDPGYEQKHLELAGKIVDLISINCHST
jgi:redox-sensitive bicupin YhaK (pirin superfamily)